MSKDPEVERQANEIQKYALTVQGALAGSLFVAAFEIFLVNGWKDVFDEAGHLIWKEVPDMLLGLIGMMLANLLVFGLGAFLFGAVRQKITRKGFVWNLIRAVLVIAAALFFGGILFTSCG